MKPGNIWSGNSELARFTNPTELARKKGKLTKSYPILFRDKQWPDAEAAYQKNKWEIADPTLRNRMLLLAQIMEAKFRQHPELIAEIQAAGGQKWIAQCSHFTNARTAEYGGPWEGQGMKSMFIRCLAEVYRRIMGEAPAVA